MFAALKAITQAIPHAFTSGNLLSGICAILAISSKEYELAAYLVMFAGLLDFFDGFLARLFKVSGDFGKQLDSLADVVSFGVVPAYMLYSIASDLTQWPFNAPENQHWIRFMPLMIGVFSALRLAKFNLDTRQATGFIGLPTPANAFWIISLPFLLESHGEVVFPIIKNLWVIGGFTVLSCFLLVAEIPLFSLKVKGLGWKENKWVYIFLIVCLVSLLLLKFAALFILIPLYIVISLFINLLNR
ncbi:MAG: CDP-diacylglycerol--serine O-phosphatidyltransferase [Bacteroidetes bacterium]|nr:MAG: CDP-diacylglycerol--serine O-phosphatidyltransferase [Bacteroidota bacterium]